MVLPFLAGLVTGRESALSIGVGVVTGLATLRVVEVLGQFDTGLFTLDVHQSFSILPDSPGLGTVVKADDVLSDSVVVVHVTVPFH